MTKRELEQLNKNLLAALLELAEAHHDSHSLYGGHPLAHCQQRACAAAVQALNENDPEQGACALDIEGEQP